MAKISGVRGVRARQSAVAKEKDRNLPQRFFADGITQKLADRYIEEVMDPNNNILCDVYFIWAQKAFL